eukprot:238659-Rhodomonas_salina.1
MHVRRYLATYRSRYLAMHRSRYLVTYRGGYLDESWKGIAVLRQRLQGCIVPTAASVPHTA